MVLGGRDVGKSSFCRALAERLAAGTGPVHLLDCDLGQKLVGPPACVTLAMFAEGDFRLQAMRFLGVTNPATDMAGVVAACARLANRAGDGRLIVNTSGLISGPGVPLKRWKVEALDPDCLVAIAYAGELEQVLAPLPRSSVMRLSPSTAARTKSSSQRALGRDAALKEALRRAVRQPLGDAVVEELVRHPPPPGTLRVCGLADADGEDMSVGLARATGTAIEPWVFTAPVPRQIFRIRLGMAAESEVVDLSP